MSKIGELDSKALAEAIAAPIREKLAPLEREVRQLKDAVRLLTQAVEKNQ